MHLFGNICMLVLAATIIYTSDGQSADNHITEYDFKPVKYKMPFPPVLKPNNRLLGVTKILQNQINGPESLLLEDGGNTIYTGTNDGKLVKIVNGEIVQSLKINGANDNQTCGTYETAPICGGGQGIRRLSPEYLVVVDAYLGLFKYNFDGENPINLLPGNFKFANGESCTLFNNLDLVMNNTKILISCSSVKWQNRQAIHDFLEGRPNGRLIEYDVANGSAKIVLSNLDFANGVQKHPDEQSVLVAELTRARIRRYYFAGPKKGKSEMFAENMPGLPDNIKLAEDGKSFFVGMDQVRHAEDLSMVDKLGPYPEWRKEIVMFVPMANMRTFYGNNLLKKQGLVLELSLDGKIINNWQDPSGTVIPGTSEASDNGTHLFIGSGSATYIAIVPK